MTNCVCSSRDLFNFGCRCTGQPKFSVWFNGIDYVIARDIDEARQLAMDTIGYSLEEADGDEGWHIVAADKTISINEDEDVTTTLTAEKWIGEIGKPEYLGCTEI